MPNANIKIKFDIVLTAHRDKLYNRTNEMHFLSFFIVKN